MYYTRFAFTVLISHRQKGFIISQSARPYSNLGTVMEPLKQSNWKQREEMIFTLNMTFAEHRVKKINRMIRVWYCDKGILYLKLFTCGLAKSFYVKGQNHNLRITLYMGSNSVWFILIFGYGRVGQFCPQNIFHSLSMFSTLFSAFSTLFLLLHFLRHSLYYINQPKVLVGPERLEQNTVCVVLWTGEQWRLEGDVEKIDLWN
jgi:hypothetical protein